MKYTVAQEKLMKAFLDVPGMKAPGVTRSIPKEVHWPKQFDGWASEVIAANLDIWPDEAKLKLLLLGWDFPITGSLEKLIKKMVHEWWEENHGK